MVKCKECNEEKYVCNNCNICDDCESSCEFCEITIKRDASFETITKGVALFLLNRIKRLIQLDVVLVCFLCNEEDDGHFWLWEEPHPSGYEAVFILDPRGYLVLSAIHEALHIIYPAMEHEEVAYLSVQVLDRLSEDQIYNFLVDILEKMERK